MEIDQENSWVNVHPDQKIERGKRCPLMNIHDINEIEPTLQLLAPGLKKSDPPESGIFLDKTLMFRDHVIQSRRDGNSMPC